MLHNDVLDAFNNRHAVIPILPMNFQGIQAMFEMFDEDTPVAFADIEAIVSYLHTTTPVVNRAATDLT